MITVSGWVLVLVAVLVVIVTFLLYVAGWKRGMQQAIHAVSLGLAEIAVDHGSFYTVTFPKPGVDLDADDDNDEFQDEFADEEEDDDDDWTDWLAKQVSGPKVEIDIMDVSGLETFCVRCSKENCRYRVAPSAADPGNREEDQPAEGVADG